MTMRRVVKTGLKKDVYSSVEPQALNKLNIPQEKSAL